MKNIAPILLGLLVITNIALILFLWKSGKSNNTINNYSDTLNVNNTYVVPKNDLPQIKPTFVINYPKSQRDTNISISLNDSLLTIIDSLTGKINSYDLAFITNFPRNPKLLFSEVKLDSLKMDFLYPDASIRSHGYSVDLQKYTYYYLEDKLTFKKNKFSLRPKDLNFYGLGGYSIFEKAPTLGLRTDLRYRRLMLYGQTQIILKSNPSSNLEFGLGFKIK